MDVGLLRWVPWPLPALLGWLAAWVAYASAGTGVGGAGSGGSGGTPAAFAVAAGVGAACSLLTRGAWRRTLVAGGFPLSALALGVLPALPGWAWLLAALPLLLAYPLRAWRDAPFFPTPCNALHGLDAAVTLPPSARLLDAGCGLGHGLRALHRLWPAAHCEGVEWSRPLAFAAGRRCRFASVRRGDMWAVGWAGFDLVYLFQRPESMARAWAKATAEMPAGSWLVSLEFEVPGAVPVACVGAPGGRPVWVYRPGDSGSSASTVRGPGR